MARARRSKASTQAPDSIARNTIFSFAAQMTTATMTAVLTVFLVRSLGPDGYGLFGLAMSIGGVVFIVADFGVSASVARFVAERRGDPESVAGLYVDALKLKLLATGSVCVLLALLAGPLADAYGEPRLAWPLRAIALATFGQSLMFMGDALFAGLGKIVLRLRVTAGESITELAASVALVLLGAGATGAAFGRSIGYVAGALFSIALALRIVGRPRLRLRRPPRRETVRRVGRYASALMVVDAAYVLSQSANTLIVGSYLGTAAAGIYRAPSRLIPLLQYPGLSVANGIGPRISRGEGREPDVGALRSGLRGLILFQGVMIAPVLVWATPIIALLLGPGYERAAEVLQYQAPYIFLTGLAPLVTISLNYLGEARRRIPVAIGTLVLTVSGALTLIPEFGLVGAVMATNFAFSFYVLGHLWLCRRALSVPLMPLARALAAALLAAAAMGLVLWLFGTERLSLLDWVLGSAGGLLAYVAVLILTRQIRPRDLAPAARSALRRRSTRVAPADLELELEHEPPDLVEPIAEPIYEIGWRSTRKGGVFVLEGDGSQAPAEWTSSPVDWGWTVPPPAIPPVTQSHSRLVERLERTGWERCGRGEAWFAVRFRGRR